MTMILSTEQQDVVEHAINISHDLNFVTIDVEDENVRILLQPQQALNLAKMLSECVKDLASKQQDFLTKPSVGGVQ